MCVSEFLPTRTVTLLLADVERPTQLLDTQTEGTTIALARLDRAVSHIIAAHDGLADRGPHQLGDLPRPERVAQLCHPDLRIEFPPLQGPNDMAPHGLPATLTRFVGRAAQINDVRKFLADNRLVTLAGAGG